MYSFIYVCVYIYTHTCTVEGLPEYCGKGTVGRGFHKRLL